ncbi:MAG: hypothetical protein U9R47_09255 [Actinomycetota bacterium]|nr:hypothetical protein [Actinomycetota bacterium]
MSDTEQLVRGLVNLVDDGVISVDEAIARIHDDAVDATPYLSHPDCARRFNDHVDLLIDACDRTAETSPSAGSVSAEIRAYRTRWNDWYDRWTGRRAVLSRFDDWGNPSLATEVVTRLCDEAALDGDDRFVEAAARVATERGSVAAVAAIVPADDPDRYRLGANHGSVTAIRMLRSLAAQGSDEAEDHLSSLAAVAEWTTQPLDG